MTQLEPKVIFEREDLQGKRRRIIASNAPGIGLFLSVEELKDDQWCPVERSSKRRLLALFDPIESIMEVAILVLASERDDLAEQLAMARQELLLNQQVLTQADH